MLKGSLAGMQLRSNTAGCLIDYLLSQKAEREPTS